jgi:uncharacterized protein
MQLNRALYDAVASAAGQCRIERICLGLGYTAVTLDDGRIGLAYTYFDRKTGCTLIRDYQDFENRPAADMLALIETRDTLERSMALALINALNLDQVRGMPADRNNDILLSLLGIGSGCRVAMVGCIRPLVTLLESKGASVEVIDEFQQVGEQDHFFRQLAQWADAALITSTAIINNTLEDILSRMGPKVRAALLGPGTPMVARAFSAWPALKALAGIVPLEPAAVLKAVRHGLGTPYLHRYCKKVTLPLAHAGGRRQAEGRRPCQRPDTGA